MKDVVLPDGSIIEGVPDGTTKAQLAAKLKASGRAVPDGWMETPKKSDYQRGREEVPGWMGGLVNVLQGPTFGFADEIAGGIGAAYKSATQPNATLSQLITGGGPKSFSENYASIRDMARGASDAVGEDFPVASRVTQTVASLPMMAAKLPQVMSGVGMVPRAVNAAAFGSVTGGLSGAGNSTADTLGGVGLDAATSAALGGVVGAASIPLADVVSKGGSAALGAVRKGAAERYAAEKVSESLARDSAAPETAITRAIARMRDLGPEARIVDAGGQNTRQLADTMATLPGKTKQAAETAIRGRQATRADRMIGAAENAFGVGGVRMSSQLDDWMQQRSAQAAPLYQKAHAMSVRVDDELRAIIDVANRNGFGSLAKKIADYDRVPLTIKGDAIEAAATASVRDLDYIKRAMDSQISTLRDPITGAATAEGRSLNGLRDALVKKLDGMTDGAYKAARDAWAGPSQLMDAARAGRDILSKDDASIRAVMAGMTASEKDAFALGAFESLRAKLGTMSGQSEVMNLWRQRGMQEKLKAVFGDERAYREFASRVAAESRMRGIESVGRGSQTAARQYGAGDLDVAATASDARAAVMGASTGNIPQAIGGVVNAWNRVKTPEQVRDEIGRILLSSDPNQLVRLQQAMQAVNASRARQSSAIGVASGNALAPVLVPMR